MKDSSAAFAALRTGEVASVATAVPPALFDQFSGSRDIQVAESTRFDSTQIFFNALKPPLNDPKLRKAVAMAIDRKALADIVLLGHGRPGRPTFVHPDSAFAVPGDGPGAQPDFDPTGARALLESASYRAGPDGTRIAPTGQPVQISLLVSSFAPEDVRAGQLVAQQLAPLGVRLTVEALDAATLRQRRNTEPGQVPAYDAYISSLEAHAHVDPDALYYFFHSPGKRGFGASITGYTNRLFDSVVEQATTADLGQRKQLLARAQEILANDAPAIVLWYRNGDWAYRPAAYDGWVPDPGQGIFTKRSFLPEYVAKARQERAQGALQHTGQQTSRSWSVPLLLGWLAALAAVAGAVALLGRRRATGDEDD